ncbi:MAG: hypothetical protein Alpg2KO_32300 [Alphaproteobacteria bacterium]
MRLPLLIALLVLLIGGAGGSVWYWKEQQLAVPNQLDAPKIMIVERGWGVIRIASELRQKGIITEDWVFREVVRRKGLATRLRAGEFEFQPGWTAAQVAEHLTRGAAVEHKVTIPEGLTSTEIAALLNADMRMSGPEVEPPPEGTVLPETLTFIRGVHRPHMLELLRKMQSDTLMELWSRRVDDLPIKTPEEAVILASIVEKETGVAEERRKVAGVFINRLNKGMRLQSDPTVIYSITKGQRPLGRPLTRADWRFESDWNTYRNKGLPPTPIAAPGRASLEAVLNPEQHDYLFFVADGTGGHAFAKTYDDHRANIRKYQR